MSTEPDWTNEIPVCRPVSLPDYLLLPAAYDAWSINPSNMPAFGMGLEPEHLALLTTKRWPSTGVDLSVQFLDNPPADFRQKFLVYANSWQNKGAVNIRFRETNQAGDVRLLRNPNDGYWSYLGTDIRSVPRNQQTMNLASFTMKTPESEWQRVVPHECGHTLGYPHEHLRRDIISLLDPEKTISYFQQHYGWSPQMTQQQVLTPLDEGSLFLGSSPTDVLSIMTYNLPGECTRNGQPIPGGSNIDQIDFETAAKFYPGAVSPPPPPPPTDGDFVSGLKVSGTYRFDRTTDGKVKLVFN